MKNVDSFLFALLFSQMPSTYKDTKPSEWASTIVYFKKDSTSAYSKAYRLKLIERHSSCSKHEIVWNDLPTSQQRGITATILKMLFKSSWKLKNCTQKRVWA